MTKVPGSGRDGAAMARLAREFLTQAGKRPFFLLYGFTDPHRAKKGFANEPFARDPKEVRYDPKQVIVPYHLPDTPEVRSDLADYYQSATRMDRNVGLLLEVLRESGQLENTLILFVSDNGIPFPGAKTNLYAAGVHLPLIVSMPGGPRGRTNQALVSFADITPTILDWARAKGPSYKLPGRSLLPILGEDNPRGWDAVFGSHQFHEITMYYPMRSLRTRDYTYLVNLAHEQEFPLPSDLWDSPSWRHIVKRQDRMMGQRSVSAFLKRPREELYDLKKDLNELRNVAGDPAHAEVLADLQGLHCISPRALFRSPGEDWNKARGGAPHNPGPG
jgi:N-sulfoglucosamine sulfohydrolase